MFKSFYDKCLKKIKLITIKKIVILIILLLVVNLIYEKNGRNNEYVYIFNGNKNDTLILLNNYNKKKDEYTYIRKIYANDSLYINTGHFYFRSKRIWFEDWVYYGETQFHELFNVKENGSTCNIFNKRFIFFGFPRNIYTDLDDYYYYEFRKINRK